MLVLAFVPLLCACAGVSVKQDYDTSVNFQKLRTYAWQTHLIEPNKGSADNSLISERVTNSTDAALANKGFQKMSSGTPDFLVDYHYSISKAPEHDNGVSTSVGFGSSSRGGGFGIFGLGIVGHSGRKPDIETLSIDIINPVTGNLMWRAFIEQEFVTRGDPNKSAQDIKKAVEAILLKFPPKNSGA
jgi:Domain of unknown function (DUF4136)